VTICGQNPATQVAGERENHAVGETWGLEPLRPGLPSKVLVRSNSLERNTNVDRADRTQHRHREEVTLNQSRWNTLSAEDSGHFRHHKVRRDELLN